MVRAAPKPDALREAQIAFLDPIHAPSPELVLPSSHGIESAASKILEGVQDRGRGESFAVANLIDISAGLNNASRSPNYYGFVIGGANPIASVADTVVSAYDQNVMVHLPTDTVSTTVEARALKMLCELLNFDPGVFKHKTFTTGATASNVLGLTCGREYIVSKAAASRGVDTSVANDGLVMAMRKGGLDEIQVLTTVPHSSLAKAASIAGLGRSCVRSVASDDEPHKFDLHKLAQGLRRPGVASIVAISCGEINTGLFATDGPTMQQIRRLCDEVGAYIHCDGGKGSSFFVLGSPCVSSGSG